MSRTPQPIASLPEKMTSRTSASILRVKNTSGADWAPHEPITIGGQVYFVHPCVICDGDFGNVMTQYGDVPLFEVPLDPAAVDNYAVGDVVYFDAATGFGTKTAAGNTRIGVAVPNQGDHRNPTTASGAAAAGENCVYVAACKA